MRLKFWGVRGSLPIPGKDTLKYGGNTSCIEVRVNDEDDKCIILDAGSGMRLLGRELMKTGFREGKGKGHLFLSHYHWDHIQGFPFFSPFFVGEKMQGRQKTKSDYNEFTIHGLKRTDISLKNVVSQLMSVPFFPLPLNELNAVLKFKEIEAGENIVLDDIKISTCRLNHPGGGLAYRLNCDDSSFVYATDTEPLDGNSVDTEILNLAMLANVLIYDATYTPEEYKKRKGWGHSTWMHGVKLAQKANVEKLILFHHDFEHSDETINEIEKKAKNEFSEVEIAREGMELEI